MFETITEIEEIPVELISPHPKNPRKDIGDITELVESIKKTGIMQNLTVIRRGNRYQLLIGHRRCAAAKAAGLEKVPCKVVQGLSESEQVAIMLEENMQRNDLTVLEQAQGFQMMLDLGETIDDVAKKSGFSKRTVQHRVNIAKLDQKLVEEKSEGKQFTIMDFIELERLKNVEDRNEILKNAQGSYQIKGMVENKLNEIARAERIERIKNICIEKGMTEAPEEFAKTRYNVKWDTVYIPDTKEDFAILDNYTWYHVESYGIYLVKEKEKKEETERELSPEEKERIEQDLKKAKIAEEITAITSNLSKNISDHIAKRVDDKGSSGIDQKQIWTFIVDFLPRYSDIKDLLIDGVGTALEAYDEEEIDEELIENHILKLDVTSQMLFIMAQELGEAIPKAIRPTHTWESGVIKADDGYLEEVFYATEKILEPDGWTWPNEETMKLFLKDHEFFKEENDG